MTLGWLVDGEGRHAEWQGGLIPRGPEDRLVPQTGLQGVTSLTVKWWLNVRRGSTSLTV
jgi:hypothetical protein